MTITRRKLLSGAAVGGATASLGLLAACGNTERVTASTPPTTSTRPAASQSVTTAETEPLQLYASPLFNNEALFTLGAARERAPGISGKEAAG